MTIEVKRTGGAYAFEATNEAGQAVAIGASPELGGPDVGPRPMELVLTGLGGCSSIDVLSILEKQRQPSPDRLTVQLDAQRRDDAPRVFTAIHLRFALDGSLDADKVQRAIELSLEKYCSVAAMLKETATITYSLTLNKEQVVTQQRHV